MSVVKTVGAGVAWNSVALTIGKVLTILNIFIILTNLSVYEYGFTELVLSVVSTISIFLLPGLVNTIIADLSVERGRENLSMMKQIFQQYFYLTSALGAIAWAVLFFGSQPIAVWAGNPYAAQFLHIAAFLFLVTPLRTVTITLSTVMLRYFEQSFYNVFEETAKLLLMLVLIVWLHTGIHGLMFSIVLSQMIVVLAYLPRTISAYRHFSSAESESGIFFWNVVREHRKWSVATSYVGMMTQNLRLWAIKLLLGTEAVGLFAFAYGVLNNISSLVPLTSAITPVIPRYIDKRDQLVRIVRASTKLQIGITLALVAAALVASDTVIHMFFPNYVKGIPVVYVILFAIVPSGVAGIFNPVFSAFKEQKSLFFSVVFKFVLMCAVLPPAIYFFGVVGPAIEIVVTSVGNCVERYYRLKRLLPTLELDLTHVLKPDPHERDAIRTIWKTVRNRLPFVGMPTKKDTAEPML